MPIDPDRLATAKRLRCANDTMAQSFKFRHRGVRNTGLEVIDSGVMKGTREIERILHIHSKINDIAEHMNLADGLELAAHYAERYNSTIVPRGKRGKQRM